MRSGCYRRLVALTGLLFALATTGTALLSPTPAQAATQIGDRSAPPQGTRTTRFVAIVEKPSTFKVFTIANPYRVIVDLPATRLQLPNIASGGGGLVTSSQGGLLAAGKTRIVIKVAKPVVVSNSIMEPGKDGQPARLVLELTPVDAKTFMAGQTMRLLRAPRTRESAAAAPKPSVTKASLTTRALKPQKKPVIVIDPGHGGHDSGAVHHGVVEKQVVLAFSLHLRDLLKSSGRYTVLMTRDTDKFVPLDERREFARRHGADLFIAVHADSFPRRNVRGATVYTLRERVHDALARSMKRRRSAVPHDGIEMGAIKEIEGDTDTLDRILRDLEKRESGSTKARNSMFAQSVIDRMGETTMMKDDPHREAAFRVLKTAQVPSVLIELAYVTNKADAQLLRSEEWKKKVATSITRAVHHYFRLSQLPL
ncbi:MAG: N-acetylmuramoyl-L-alanine amidase [Hyphomicrobiaceae bacterium]|nr:N-acetylmuramoyl-L-alanine amidase [Hyphomicrobiaceae bacterium]